MSTLARLEPVHPLPHPRLIETHQPRRHRHHHKQRRGRALTRRRPSSRAGELRRRCRGVRSALRLILLRKQTRVDLRHAAVHAARRQAVLRRIDALVQTRQQRSCTRRHVAELRVVCSALALRVEGTEHAGMIERRAALQPGVQDQDQCVHRLQYFDGRELAALPADAVDKCRRTVLAVDLWHDRRDRSKVEARR